MDVDDDEKLIRELLSGAFGGVANFTQFEGWRLDDEREARQVSGPAARILNRHPEWAEAFRERGDAVALIFGAIAITMPRLMLYKMWREEMEAAAIAAINEARHAPRNPPPSNMPPHPDQTPPATGNGRVVDINNLRDRMNNP